MSETSVFSEDAGVGGTLQVKRSHTHTHTHARARTHTRTHARARAFNGPFSGNTQVSQYQKGKTNLDFTEARDSEWRWHQLGHMQVCILLQTDNHTSTPPLLFFTGRMPFLPPNQQRQSTEGNQTITRLTITSCYSTDSQWPHRCCPLANNIEKTAHPQVLPSLRGVDLCKNVGVSKFHNLLVK